MIELCLVPILDLFFKEFHVSDMATQREDEGKVDPVVRLAERDLLQQVHARIPSTTHLPLPLSKLF
mgnify:CR=1 FL=1